MKSHARGEGATLGVSWGAEVMAAELWLSLSTPQLQTFSGRMLYGVVLRKVNVIGSSITSELFFWEPFKINLMFIR